MSSIEAVSAAVSALSADLAGDTVSGTDAAALLPQVAEQASRLNAALVTLTGVVDSSGVWGLDRSRSAAAYVSRATRVSRAAAGSDVKLARALAGPLPLTAQAVAQGSVPIGHARAIAQLCLRSAKSVELSPTRTGVRRSCWRMRTWGWMTSGRF